MVTRNQIISEAKTWIGTPFHYHARIKGVGCDCVGLIIGVSEALGIQCLDQLLLPNYDVYKDKDYLLECMYSNFKSGSKTKGAIAVVGSKDRGWHIGLLNTIVGNKFTWIHSCMITGMVTEKRFFGGAFYFDFPMIDIGS